MGNITLLRRDAYLDLGVKPDTLCALPNSPLNSLGMFPDDMTHGEGDEIPKTEAESRTIQPRSAMAGIVLGNRYQLFQGGWNRQDANDNRCKLHVCYDSYTSRT